MVTHAFVNIDRKEAAYLADLTGIEHDLQSTIKLCNKLLEIRDLTAEEIEEIDIFALKTLKTYLNRYY